MSRYQGKSEAGVVGGGVDVDFGFGTGEAVGFGRVGQDDAFAALVGGEGEERGEKRLGEEHGDADGSGVFGGDDGLLGVGLGVDEVVVNGRR